MKKRKYLISGIIFFFISLVLVLNYKPLLNIFPAQEVNLSNGVAFGAVLKDYLFVQEITLKKKYINRIDVYLAKLPSQIPNENVFLLLDSRHQILFTKRFSSTDFGESLFFPFDFQKSFNIGEGNKVYACIYSIDADNTSYIGLARKTNSKLGKLFVTPIQNNDIVQTIENQQSVVVFEGSIGLKSFESDSTLFSTQQIPIYILMIFFTGLIFSGRKLKSFLINTRIIPEFSFLGISLVFGLLMVAIIPPFQVPDEPLHFYRSFQIAEFNFFKFKTGIPQSLVRLTSICDRMKFNTHEKTSREEILSLADIKPDPENQTMIEPPNYTIPYLPQAVGIFIGKIFHLRPLWLFYFGRVLNLFVSIMLIFFAIKTTPVLKWLFFLLGIMPMTLYQLASLSYDAMTISLSFLLVAILLNFALNEEKIIRYRDLLLLFLISVLLASGKPPYFLVAFTFVIIPVRKVGSWKKFAATFIALTVITILVSISWSPGRNIFGKLGHINNPVKTTTTAYCGEDLFTKHFHNLQNPFTLLLPLLPHGPVNSQAGSNRADTNTGNEQKNQQPAPVESTNNIKQQPVNQYDPSAQQKFIRENPIRYLGIIFNTIGKSIGLYLVSFVGLFGWIDTFLPLWLAYAYLMMLLIISLLMPTEGMQLNFLTRSIFISISVLTFFLIETALYLYCNPVGSDQIIAVQGRYFIAFSPLIFMLFYNNRISTTINKIIIGSKVSTDKESHNKKKKPFIKTQKDDIFIIKVLPWIAIFFGSFTLIYSLYLIIGRFYIVMI